MNDHKPEPTRKPPSLSNRTLAQSYAALPARTRLGFSIAVCLFATAGIVASDYLEEKIPTSSKSSEQ